MTDPHQVFTPDNDGKGLGGILSGLTRRCPDTMDWLRLKDLREEKSNPIVIVKMQIRTMPGNRKWLLT